VPFAVTISEYQPTADPASVAGLTASFVQGSEAYRALGPGARRAADAALASATGQLAHMAPALKPQYVAGYKTGVSKLALGGWLTQRQADVLSVFADAL
jgi:hypothetical protein